MELWTVGAGGTTPADGPWLTLTEDGRLFLRQTPHHVALQSVIVGEVPDPALVVERVVSDVEFGGDDKFGVGAADSATFIVIIESEPVAAIHGLTSAGASPEQEEAREKALALLEGMTSSSWWIDEGLVTSFADAGLSDVVVVLSDIRSTPDAVATAEWPGAPPAGAGCASVVGEEAAELLALERDLRPDGWVAGNVYFEILSARFLLPQETACDPHAPSLSLRFDLDE